MFKSELLQVAAPDGARTTVECTGPVKAPGVIFIHGVLHSRLIWKRQFADPALSGLRLAAYDVRGHGDADKPEDRGSYDAERYADELQAVIGASGIERPVLVGWSLGSRVMFNYLAAHGWSRIGGVMIVGARMKTVDIRPKNSVTDALGAAASDDLETRIRSRKEFVQLCHEIPPSPDDLLEIVAASMVVPPYVLNNIVGRPLDNEALMARLDVPILIAQGLRDPVSDPAYAEAAAKLNPRAILSRYENVGHTPFFEAPERFNCELVAFVRDCAANRVAQGAGAAVR